MCTCHMHRRHACEFCKWQFRALDDFCRMTNSGCNSTLPWQARKINLVCSGQLPTNHTTFPCSSTAGELELLLRKYHYVAPWPPTYELVSSRPQNCFNPPNYRLLCHWRMLKYMNMPTASTKISMEASINLSLSRSATCFPHICPCVALRSP